MEHEEIYTLMMEALDGQLNDRGRSELESHLVDCQTCARSWQAVQAIHQLFLQSPVLSPAAGFTQRTLARLPNTRYRIYALTAVYGVLLFSGILPLIIFLWFALNIGPALNQPAFIRGLLQAGDQLFGILQTIVGAFWQGLGMLGELLGQYPSAVGWLLVMIGAIFLWGGVYSQLTRQQRITNNHSRV